MNRSWPQYVAKLPKRYVLLAAAFVTVGAFTISIQGQSLASLLASATSSLRMSASMAHLTPYEDTTLNVGEVAHLDVDIHSNVPFNAIDVTLVFPPDLIEVVGISKEKSFLDLWIEDTVIREDVGEIHFSGGTTRRGGVDGIGTALTLSVRAKKAGVAELYFKDTQILASDGKGTALDHEEHPLTYEIITPHVGVSSTDGTMKESQAPSPDFNDSGTVTLIDVSILALHMLTPYDSRYDLDMDGSVGLSDLSILFAAMKAE